MTESAKSYSTEAVVDILLENQAIGNIGFVLADKIPQIPHLVGHLSPST